MGSGNMPPGETKPENLEAMIKAVRKYGIY